MFLSGTALAQEITDLIGKTITENNLHPTLAVIQVGDDAASSIYVNKKRKVAENLGIATTFIQLPDTATTDEVIKEVVRVNENPKLTALLIQLPLPAHIDTNQVMESIDPAKDVDGFHEKNIAAYISGKSIHTPVLIQAVEWLLGKTNESLTKKSAVIVGKSDIFLKPLSFMLERYGMNVSWTKPPEINSDKTKAADVLIVAVGSPKIITQEMVKPGAIVIDIGINRTENGRVCGDVDETVNKSASWITPTPGGVGPVTIAALMWNTVRLALDQSTD